jgi:hypothetical protein
MTTNFKGKCYSCGNVYSKRGMTRHIKSCQKLKERLQQGQKEEEMYFMLRVQAKYNKRYFLYLDIKHEAFLAELDQFLRDIWLECCNHLSEFKVDGMRYTFPNEYNDGLNAGVRLIDVANEGTVLEYQYDFGSTTALEIEVLQARRGKKREHLIEILARNLKPDFKCAICGKQASWISWDDFSLSYYCAECIKEYEGDYGASPIANSPRMGVCGYTGPADKYRNITKWNG